MRKRLTQLQKLQKIRDSRLCEMYTSGRYTTEQIAKHFGVTTRAVQRCARKYGVIRTQAESNRLMAPLKAYHRMRVPEELRVKRQQLSNKRRFEVISEQPWCSLCGARPADGVVLHVDHKDDDQTNNDRANLQVLCHRCNRGKADHQRFGASESSATLPSK